MKIIITRTDNIGDVVLTLPMASLLKERFPEATIFFITRDYVKTVVECCKDVDRFISWDMLSRLDTVPAVKILENLEADMIIFLNPNRALARLSKKAKIPKRIGTTRPWFHWRYCNHRLHFRRVNIDKHESQVNLEFVKHLGINSDLSLDILKTHLHVAAKPEWVLATKTLIDPTRFNLIIHPGSNGHAREWPATHFADLINSLPKNRFNIFITGGDIEAERFKALTDTCPEATNLMGKTSLNELTALIATADGLVTGSTGPVHIAAAFGIHTLGLYPPHNPKRWAPLGAKAEYLVTNSVTNCATECTNENCACMRAIAVNQVKERILGWV